MLVAFPWISGRCFGADAAVAAGGATAPQLITNIGQFNDLPDADKDVVHPVRMELKIFYYDPYWKLLWGNDGTFDTYVPLASASPRVKSGQRILVEGSISKSKGLDLREAKITLLAESEKPQPLSTRGQIGDPSRFDAHVVTADAYVNRQVEVDQNHLLLELAIEGRTARARILLDDLGPVPQLEGARIRLTGVYIGSSSPAADSARIDIWISRASDVEILGWLDRDPDFELPITTVDRLPSAPAQTLVHVAGVVRSQSAGNVVIRDETGQLSLMTAMTRYVAAGERIEAIGYPFLDGADTVLREALFRISKTKVEAPPLARGLPLLRLIDQVRNLKPEDAERGYTVRLHGIVTWSSRASSLFFIRDSSGGIGVQLDPNDRQVPSVGSELEVTGISAVGAFAPIVKAEKLVASDVQVLPEARVVSLEHAMTGVEEGQLVSLSGYVRAVATEGSGNDRWTRLDLTTSAGEFTARVPYGAGPGSKKGFVVRLRGVCVATTNAQRQLTGIQLWVASEDDIEVEEAKPADPFRVPLRTIASLRQFSTLGAFNRRVRIGGVVLNFEAGRQLNLQEGSQGLLALTRESVLLRPGDRVEVVGFPGRQGNRIVLRESEYRIVRHEGEPPPVVLTQLEPIDPDLDGRLVAVEATLLDVAAQVSGLRLNCQSNGTVFEATMNLGSAGAHPQWAPGSKIFVTGVYESEFDGGARPHSLRLRLRSQADVRVLREPSWWTARHALAVSGFLVIAMFLGLGWVFALRRRVERQTEQIREQLEKSSRLETELVRSSKLDSLGVLAGGIAHDFNNLLTVVMGNLSLVIDDRRMDSEAEHFLRESARAALRARDLTHQLLTFAKGGAPIRTAVLLPDIVREAAGFALHGANVRCEFDFAADLWPADVDRGQIAQVVQNLVINATQAMPSGGIVRVSLRNERIAADQLPMLGAGRYLKLQVMDSGAGIPPEHLVRIFEPYFTTKRQGNGLGLAGAYSIIKKHGGHIDVESKLGKGTVFNIWLPAAASAPEPVATTAGRATKWTGKVLFMDDEEPIREFANALLKRMGFDVTLVCDGAEAVGKYSAARAAGQPYAFVILDLTVPGGMGGSEALTKLRECDPSVRAIVSSGYSSDPVLANYRAHGLCGIVPKPYQADELINAVNSVMRDARN